MTNNEAIETLRANYPDACFGQLREAVDMAIAALTRQIENTTQDAAQMSLSSAQQSMTATSNTRMSNTVKIPVMDGTTERLPSAQPERKKGKWIKHVDDLFPAESTIECSMCHHEQPITIDDNYCPHCGAGMEGE